jgi:small multidrug resistance family-3 protein
MTLELFDMLKTTGLFVITALAEIVGCFLPFLWLRKNGSAWLLVPAVFSLAAFVWLLTLHPTSSGRVYAAYGGVYVATALVWLRVVDGMKLSTWDWIGAGISLLGMMVIVLGWRNETV